MINVTQPDQRVAVFVDVQNMYYSAKNLYNSFVDFGAILKNTLLRMWLKLKLVLKISFLIH